MSNVAAIWSRPFPDAAQNLDEIFRKAPRAEVFFRADDVGPWSRAFARLLELFASRRTPLSLCATPAWTSEPRARLVRQAVQGHEHLFPVLVHGFRHLNHEPPGQRKCEFGPARDPEAKRRDLERGAARLARLFPETFRPVFVPPWNRCDGETLKALAELGYVAVSRTPEAVPDPPAPLARLDVNVDLHTRKEPDPALSAQALLHDLAKALDTGVCGIMIHHNRMNNHALDFLATLLDTLSPHLHLKKLD